MDVRLLGPLEVVAAGNRLALGGTKQRAVLAMLALHADRVVALDSLVDGLWGERPPPTAVNAVQVHVSALRKVLRGAAGSSPEDGPAVLRRGPGYLLRCDPGAVDLWRFESLVRDGVRALPADPALAAATLREALGLWRGAPLAEFVHEPFAAPEAARLGRRRLDALTARGDADLALGRPADVVGELEELVSQHPLREQFARQLVLALYRSGRQAEALQAHRRVRHVLADELGVDPSRQLQELEAAVLAQDPRIDWVPPDAGPLSREPAPAAPVGVRRVPARNPHFTGRDDELDELHRRLRAGEGVLTVQALHGLGGVGKTQVVVEYAHRFADEYDVVWWIDAEQPVLVPDQLARLATSLAVPVGPAVADTVDAVLSALRGRQRWLLVFDNAERPQDLAGYLPHGPGHVLVTSRQPGWGALGGRLEVQPLTRSGTVALLRRRLPDLDDELAGALAEELGDLPLAVAQAAAYVEETGLPPADYLRRFRTRRSGLLARGEVLGYEGTLDTTWTLSLDRLREHSPAGLRLLHLAAFLAPEPVPVSLLAGHLELLSGPSRDAAVDRDGLDDALGAVVGLSLARRQGDGFRVHRLVQAVVRHHLCDDERQAVGTRAAALLVAARPGAPEDPAAWDAWACLAPHVLATSELLDQHDDGRRLLLATLAYLDVRGDTPTCRTLAADLLDRWRERLGPDHPDTLSLATTLVTMLDELGLHPQARELGADTLDRCRRVLGPDHPDTLRAAMRETVGLAGLGQGGGVHDLGEDTVERCRRTLGPDHPTTLLAAADLTFALAWLGEVDLARRLAQDTHDRGRAVLGPGHPTTLRAAANLAHLLGTTGDLEGARRLASHDLDRCRRVLGADHPTTLFTAIALAHAQVVLGDPAGIALAEDTAARCERVHGPDHGMTLLPRAVLLLSRSGHRVAATEHAAAHDVLERCRRLLGDGNPLVPAPTRAVGSLVVDDGSDDGCGDGSRRVPGRSTPTAT